MAGFRLGLRFQNIFIKHNKLAGRKNLCYNEVMVRRRNVNFVFRTIFVAVFAISLTALLVNFTRKADAYNCREGDTECEAAKANMQQNQSAANDYTNKANSVSEVISQLDVEIFSLNAQIAANEAKVEELNGLIKENEEKLADNQAALVELLIMIHFTGNSEPITVLAGSESISDFAEKQARDEVVKQEVVAASERVKQIKEELDSQKNEVEIALAASEEQRNLVSVKRSDQNALRTQYESSASEASALADYWENQLKMLAWTPPSNTTGSGNRTWGANNTYPYRYNCPQDNVMYMAYGGAVCQCTSYASYKAYEKYGITNTWGGHAYSYIYASGYTVPSTGFTTYVDQSPAPNTIAVQLGGAYGHVMWVESVNADGSINVTEYNVNWPGIGCYIGDFCSRSGVGSAGTYFVHFE